MQMQKPEITIILESRGSMFANDRNKAGEIFFNHYTIITAKRSAFGSESDERQRGAVPRQGHECTLPGG